MKGSTQNRLTPQEKRAIVSFYGVLSTKELANRFEVSAKTIRDTWKKKGLDTSKKPVDRSRSCVVCGTTFTPKSHDGKKKDKYITCSDKCSKESSYKKRKYSKYTQGQIDQVIELKKQFETNKNIVEATGVNLNTVKTIVKENNLTLTPEQRQKNAHDSIKKKKEEGTFSKKEIEKKYTEEDFQEVMDMLKGSGISLVGGKFERKSSIELECPKHGKFVKKYSLIKKGEYCYKCAIEKRSDDQRYSIDFIKAQLSNLDYELVSEYITSQENVKIRCKKHGLFEMRYNAIQQGQRCPKCSAFRSRGEREVEEYIQSLGFVTEHSNREIIKPKEIDIVVPEMKLAIEYDGLYTHSDARFVKPKDYHLKKYQEITEKGYRFFSIYEDEWKLKPELVKSMIRARLGIFSVVLRASKLEVRKLDKNKQFDWFFEKNHLEGHANSSYAYGLFDKDELVSCLSMRRAFDDTWEIARFANKVDYKIHGGFSKLLKNISSRPIKSFSHNRIGSGNVYGSNGFVLTDEKLGYCYTDFKNRVSRHKCTKINEPEIVKEYPTEDDQARAGVLSPKAFGHEKPIFKVWNHGVKRWLLTL